MKHTLAHFLYMSTNCIFISSLVLHSFYIWYCHLYTYFNIQTFDSELNNNKNICEMYKNSYERMHIMYYGKNMWLLWLNEDKLKPNRKRRFAATTKAKLLRQVLGAEGKWFDSRATWPGRRVDSHLTDQPLFLLKPPALIGISGGGFFHVQLSC